MLSGSALVWTCSTSRLIYNAALQAFRRYLYDFHFYQNILIVVTRSVLVYLLLFFTCVFLFVFQMLF